MVSNWMFLHRRVLNRMVSNRMVLNRMVSDRTVLNRMVLNRMILNRVVLNRMVLDKAVLNQIVLTRMVLSRMVFNRIFLNRMVLNGYTSLSSYRSARAGSMSYHLLQTPLSPAGTSPRFAAIARDGLMEPPASSFPRFRSSTTLDSIEEYLGQPNPKLLEMFSSRDADAPLPVQKKQRRRVGAGVYSSCSAWP